MSYDQISISRKAVKNYWKNAHWSVQNDSRWSKSDSNIGNLIIFLLIIWLSIFFCNEHVFWNEENRWYKKASKQAEANDT